ncbi:MAG: metallophosphoesterase [Deltaproteobacteria bacterium]|nr:metallophosphoesterase [Deltaproteobacteria bacterium]
MHGFFDEEDVRLFDAGGYDLIVFVGDLAGLRLSSTLRVAGLIAQLTTPTLVVPGNHDAPNAVQLLGEVLHSRALIRLADRNTEGRADAIAAALGSPLAGYSLHDVGLGMQIVAGRPHSMGGDALSFAPFLKRRFGVESLEASADRLCRLVDESTAPNLLFVAHNGPLGLGDRRDDIWGCDFRAEEGDFGDRDLAVAVDYARAQGRAVVAVVAGHMHSKVRGGGERTARVERDGTLYLNAARVPRIWNDPDGRPVRHHLAVSWDGATVRAEEMRW